MFDPDVEQNQFSCKNSRLIVFFSFFEGLQYGDCYSNRTTGLMRVERNWEDKEVINSPVINNNIKVS